MRSCIVSFGKNYERYKSRPKLKCVCVYYFYSLCSSPAHYKHIVKHETALRASRSNNSHAAAKASLSASSPLKEKFCARSLSYFINRSFGRWLQVFLLLFLCFHHSAEFVCVSLLDFYDSEKKTNLNEIRIWKKIIIYDECVIVIKL